MYSKYFSEVLSFILSWHFKFGQILFPFSMFILYSMIYSLTYDSSYHYRSIWIWCEINNTLIIIIKKKIFRISDNQHLSF